MLFTAFLPFVLQGAFAQIGTGVVPGGCVNCQVSGEWSPWSEWAECVTMFGTQSQTRYRTCSMATCVGTSSEARPCITYVQPQIAQWGEWGPWGACSASCGGGTCTRTRLCNNACTTCQCVGAATQTMSCNTQPCCEYGPWSPWSPCSVTCGTNGVTYRTRQCSCPEGCEGPASEQKVCNADQPCPPPLYEQQTPAPIVSPPTFCITCYLPQPPCITCINYAPFVYGYGRRKRQTEKLE